jgi:hypothetical protein
MAMTALRSASKKWLYPVASRAWSSGAGSKNSSKLFLANGTNCTIFEIEMVGGFPPKKSLRAKRAADDERSE